MFLPLPKPHVGRNLRILPNVGAIADKGNENCGTYNEIEGFADRSCRFTENSWDERNCPDTETFTFNKRFNATTAHESAENYGTKTDYTNNTKSDYENHGHENFQPDTGAFVCRLL
jgi:hypothetical protein